MRFGELIFWLVLWATFLCVIVLFVHALGMANYRRKVDRLLIAIGKLQIDQSKLWEAVVAEKQDDRLDTVKSILRRNRLELEAALNELVKAYNEMRGLPGFRTSKRVKKEVKK